MTGYVATRWYRAPEIVLNWMHYSQTGQWCSHIVCVGLKLKRHICKLIAKDFIFLYMIQESIKTAPCQ